MTDKFEVELDLSDERIDHKAKMLNYTIDRLWTLSQAEDDTARFAKERDNLFHTLLLMLRNAREREWAQHRGHAHWKPLLQAGR